MSNMAQTPRIVIVGCGAAGYSAACRLLDNNFTNITILEAENRIGGRVNTVSFDNTLVDLGAQWCHGKQNNIVYSMVANLNLLQSSKCDYQNVTFVDSSSNFVESSVTDIYLNLLYSFAENQEKLKEYSGSFGDYIQQNYEKKIKSESLETNQAIAKQVLDWYHKVENNLNACANWFELSAKGYAEYTECEGDKTLNWKDKGYKIIFSVLNKELPNSANKLPVDDKILFNKEVTKVLWDNKVKNNDIIVECADGSQFRADHVIITVSLGVLKHVYCDLFVPELPLYKKNAIEGLSFGCVNKIYLKFPRKWWSGSIECGINFLWKQEDEEEILTEFSEGPKKDGKSWLTAFFGFHPIDSNPNILLGFVNGEFCKNIECLSDDLIIRGCMYLLKKFVGKHFDVPMPDAVLRSSWVTNKHFRGSYSFHSLETFRKQTNSGELAKPLGDNAVLFAGEATHPVYFSTVHGAIETGFREADRIISQYNTSMAANILKCNIAIVGAGIAGLATAVTLAQAGCTNILLLEAQEKPGGRIQSLEIADGFIDLGAQWLHGDRNTLWKISHDNNLLSNKTVYEGRGVFLREDGFKFDNNHIDKVNFIIGRILEECEQFVDSVDVPDSVGKYLEEKFGEYLKQNSIPSEDIRLYLELYDWNVRFQVIDNCCDNLYNLSAKFWGKYFCPASEGQAHINYSKGHSSVIDVLVNQLPKNSLLTDHPVANINWTVNNSNVVKLRCQNGKIIEADSVVVTSSLGILKQKANQLFTPSLPNDMTEIISAMGFASIGKIFLVFEERWWKDEEGFQLIWNFDHPYNDDDWCRYLSGFDPVLDQPHMLLGWIGGRGAELVEAVPEEEIGIKCAELLRKFTQNINISNPVQVIRSKWSTNPWILGGYSHTTPKCDEQVLLPETLQRPLRDQQSKVRVLLAGEHTHAEHFSTTHGAYESGARQAQILLDEGVAKINFTKTE